MIYTRRRMLFKKTVQAKIVAKIIEEVEEPPLVGASKDTSLMFLTAMKDESHSMWKRSELCLVSFDIGGRTKDFYVSRDVFGSLEKGDEGILTYSGNEFIEFSYTEGRKWRVV